MHMDVPKLVTATDANDEKKLLRYEVLGCNESLLTTTVQLE